MHLLISIIACFYVFTFLYTVLAMKWIETRKYFFLHNTIMKKLSLVMGNLRDAVKNIINNIFSYISYKTSAY